MGGELNNGNHGGHAVSEHSGLANQLERDARIHDLVTTLRESEDALTTREAAEQAGVPHGSAKHILSEENVFAVAKSEHIKGASRRYYWQVDPDVEYTKPAIL